MIKHTWSSILTPCKLVLTTASIDKGRLGEKSFLIHLSTAISKYIVHINTVEKRNYQWNICCCSKSPPCKIGNSPALRCSSLGTDQDQNLKFKVGITLLLYCETGFDRMLPTDSIISFHCDQKRKSCPLVRHTLECDSESRLKDWGLKRWHLMFVARLYDSLQVSSACEGEEKVVYAGKHGTREEEKGCPSLPGSKLADFS